MAFVGRIQPLKAPDIVLRAAAKLPGVRIIVAGGPSGSGLASPDGLVRLADELGISARVTFLPPQSHTDLATLFRAAARHAATFSWENTTDALLASYRRAIGEYNAERQRRGGEVISDLVAVGKPRHWTPRRGVGA